MKNTIMIQVDALVVSQGLQDAKNTTKTTHFYIVLKTTGKFVYLV